MVDLIGTEVMKVLIPFILFLTVIQFIFAFVYKQQRKQYREVLSQKRIRGHFAVARDRLLKLATEKKLDIHSDTFQMLYTLYTAIMRNPERYAQLSERLLKLSLDKDTHTGVGVITRESEFWDEELSQEIKSLVTYTAKGFQVIIVEYSPSIRGILTLLDMLEGLLRFFRVQIVIELPDAKDKLVAQTSKSKREFRQAYQATELFFKTAAAMK